MQTKVYKITQKTRGAEPKGTTKGAREYMIVVNNTGWYCSGIVFGCDLAKTTI